KTTLNNMSKELTRRGRLKGLKNCQGCGYDYVLAKIEMRKTLKKARKYHIITVNNNSKRTLPGTKLRAPGRTRNKKI
ncbi:unnamed protein product, partial [Ceratitis capitata]